MGSRLLTCFRTLLESLSSMNIRKECEDFFHRSLRARFSRNPVPSLNWAHYVGSSTSQISQALAAFRAFSYVLHPSAQSTHLNSPILTCWPLPLLVAAPPTGAPVWTDPPLSLVLKGEFEFQKIKRGVLSLRVLMIRILGFYIKVP